MTHSDMIDKAWHSASQAHDVNEQLRLAGQIVDFYSGKTWRRAITEWILIVCVSAMAVAVIVSL